jgi:hypothetical protein
MARERKGTLVYRAKPGWCARVTVTHRRRAGETVAPARHAQSDCGQEKASAAAREARRGDGPRCPDAAAEETVAEYKRAWIASRRAAGVVIAKDEDANLTGHVLPHIGKKPLSKVRPPDLRAILENVVALAYSQQTVRHVRAAMFRLFKAAWQDELIHEYPVARVEVPRVPGIKKERCILTDGELASYLESPVARDVEVKIMGLAARVEARAARGAAEGARQLVRKAAPTRSASGRRGAAQLHATWDRGAAQARREVLRRLRCRPALQRNADHAPG